ncbi:hypothetical protein C7H61_06275 [Mesoflavibacter zeaxanthinifaciens subsp. sabulilitoris]|uniref:Inner membrane protein YgaP-like transmembrane domain-containing protein n=2 Tax=Mesoflavibacter TaxID=444051 RepID=A0A2T1NH69_9FLAO|nr:hypothetical protein C7H61_06275 [Mesoflavibacter zeaxanthinifaciens subsp. sabulilitoris]
MMIKLKRNMSNFDRLVRFIVVLLLISILYVGEFNGPIAFIIIVVSAMFLFASVTAFCPFYKSTNMTTYDDSEDYL